MPRLFTAIETPESIRHKIAWLRLPAAKAARIVPPDDLHITLHFIGEVSDEVCDNVQAGLRSIAASSFYQELKGIGVFANERRPEILWVGVEPSLALRTLWNAIGDVLKSHDIALDHRDFRPHITVARMKHRSPAAAETFMQDNEAFHAGFTATGFGLYRVNPGGNEPHYRMLEEYRLNTKNDLR